MVLQEVANAVAQGLKMWLEVERPTSFENCSTTMPPIHISPCQRNGSFSVFCLTYSLQRTAGQVIMKALLVIGWATVLLLTGKCQTPQENVLSDGRKNGLFLWIYLKKDAAPKSIIETVTELQLLADEICPPVIPKHLAKSFPHVARGSGVTGMPNSGGDLFVHAKSDSRSNLFEFSRLITNKIKPFIEKFDDIYGFVYKDNRDLSGFVDGTENPSEEDRSAICIEQKTGGSYCMTQKWIHDLAFIASQPDNTMESFIGRTIHSDQELNEKSETSHLSRTRAGTEYKGPKPFQIYRQSMPFGKVSTEAGLLFIAFANSTKNFDYMLDRMFGASEDGLSDDIIHFTKCVQSNYWYFPSKEELKCIAQYDAYEPKMYCAGALLFSGSLWSPFEAVLVDFSSSSSSEFYLTFLVINQRCFQGAPQ
ncbi:hypothetical protein M513_06161 [Trichuris suis]|uniref:Dyp-type peroxidase C-terminal domain-containing protein n=1 Tax=Trichuris suis TaxID=68888 RepID=A0A085M749_9BILA|nr:hypothetical protein M513_06161 [Trichuris suis]